MASRDVSKDALAVLGLEVDLAVVKTPNGHPPTSEHSLILIRRPPTLPHIAYRRKAPGK